jgi:hypothetical protein
MDKKQELLDALRKTSVFSAQLAERLRRRHGSENARPIVEMHATLDELIRAVSDSALIDEVLSPTPPELILIKQAKPATIKLKKDSAIVH